MKAFVLFCILGPCVGFRLQRKVSPEAPSTIPYNPVDLLCKFGDKEQQWCRDWLTCIETEAKPPSIENVRKAWDPADCKEICGVWPATTEGGALIQAREAKIQKLYGSASKSTIRTQGECMTSCENFQESLVTCVGTIMFEPGKMAMMSARENHGPPPPEVCTRKDTHCLPDLPVRAQQCMGLKSKAYLKGDKFHGKDCMGSKEPACVCKQIEVDYEDCKACPQMSSKGGSQVTTFVGGCMDQLNAYWQATLPDAGKQALPGASGCTVHKAVKSE